MPRCDMRLQPSDHGLLKACHLIRERDSKWISAGNVRITESAERAVSQHPLLDRRVVHVELKTDQQMLRQAGNDPPCLGASGR